MVALSFMLWEIDAIFCTTSILALPPRSHALHLTRSLQHFVIYGVREKFLHITKKPFLFKWIPSLLLALQFLLCRAVCIHKVRKLDEKSFSVVCKMIRMLSSSYLPAPAAFSFTSSSYCVLDPSWKSSSLRQTWSRAQWDDASYMAKKLFPKGIKPATTFIPQSNDFGFSEINTPDCPTVSMAT